jgi:hypothetical protein
LNEKIIAIGAVAVFVVVISIEPPLNMVCFDLPKQYW